MSRRDLSVLDRDIGQPWSRIIMESFRDGSTGAVISEGGLIPSQTAHGTLSVSATQVYTYGTKREEDGKIYRYCKGSTTTALIAGQLVESPAYGGAYDVVEEDAVIPADGDGTSGTSTVVCEQESSVCAADRFTDGTILINKAANVGGGQSRKISANTLSTGTGSEVTFTVTEPWSVTVTTGATATIMANPCANVLTTTTGGVVGVTMGVPRVAFTTTNCYGWIQRSGPAAVRCGGTAQTLGQAVYRDSGSSGGGSVILGSSGAFVFTEPVGYSMLAGDVADFAFVNLTLE